MSRVADKKTPRYESIIDEHKPSEESDLHVISFEDVSYGVNLVDEGLNSLSFLGVDDVPVVSQSCEQRRDSVIER